MKELKIMCLMGALLVSNSLHTMYTMSDVPVRYAYFQQGKMLKNVGSVTRYEPKNFCTWKFAHVSQRGIVTYLLRNDHVLLYYPCGNSTVMTLDSYAKLQDIPQAERISFFGE